MPDGYRYTRRVQFAETDLAGVVHFSWFFRYMEEAEHALWRAAGLTIDQAGSGTGWPRVAASFDFQNPLRFDEEFDVVVRLNEVSRVTIQYGFTISRSDTPIGSGSLTAACASRSDGTMRAKSIPDDVVRRLRAAAGQTP